MSEQDTAKRPLTPNPRTRHPQRRLETSPLVPPVPPPAGRGRTSGVSAAARVPSPGSESPKAPARSKSTAGASTIFLTNERDRKAIFGPLEVNQHRREARILRPLHRRGVNRPGRRHRPGHRPRPAKSRDKATEAPLRTAGFLTRDSRMKERKKYGQRGARRRSSSASDNLVAGRA